MEGDRTVMMMMIMTVMIQTVMDATLCSCSCSDAWYVTMTAVDDVDESEWIGWVPTQHYDTVCHHLYPSGRLQIALTPSPTSTIIYSSSFRATKSGFWSGKWAAEMTITITAHSAQLDHCRRFFPKTRSCRHPALAGCYIAWTFPWLFRNTECERVYHIDIAPSRILQFKLLFAVWGTSTYRRRSDPFSDFLPLVSVFELQVCLNKIRLLWAKSNKFYCFCVYDGSSRTRSCKPCRAATGIHPQAAPLIWFCFSRRSGVSICHSSNKWRIHGLIKVLYSGVVTGKNCFKLLEYAREHQVRDDGDWGIRTTNWFTIYATSLLSLYVHCSCYRKHICTD